MTKFDRWTWRDSFSASVPTTWKVKDDGDVVEIVPSRNDGALHITRMRKTNVSAPTSEEASTLVQNFARNNGLRQEKEITERKWVAGVSAEGRFESMVGAHDAPRFWIVRSFSTESKALLCTYCYDDKSSESTKEALYILDSIDMNN